MAQTEYKKLTITSLPDNTGEYSVSTIRKDLNKFVNDAIKSAIPEGDFYKVGKKQLLPNGQMSVDVYVHERSAPLAEKSARELANEIKFKGSTDPKYAVSYATDVGTGLTRKLRREERDEAKKTESEETRNTKHNLLKIFGILVTLADITRRILSSVLTLAERTTKDMVTASNLGMSYEAVRGYRHTEAVHGLKEGTITGAISDLQMKFGNITSLDEKALEALAVVMGGKIEDMVKMGLGASNPEKVLATILDEFNAKANAGYNSVGQYVGEQQARRELYSYLLKVSPQIADIFATMQEEQHNINSLYRNQADTFENWKNAFPVDRGKPNWSGYGTLSIADQQWKKVEDILSQIKQGILMSLAPDIVAILRRIGNSRIFMTESERRNANVKNREANENQLASINKTLAMYESSYNNMSAGGKAYYDVLVEQKKALEEELDKEEIDDITMLQAEVEARAERKIRKQGKALDYDVAGVVPLSDVTYDEIKEVADVYNLDNAENRKLYENYRKKQAKQSDAYTENFNLNQKKKYEDRFWEEWNSKELSKKFSKDTKMKEYAKRLGRNTRAKQDLQLLYKLSQLYGFDIDLDKEEGYNTEEKLYSALKRLSKEDPRMVSMDTMGKWKVDSQPYVDKNFKPIGNPSDIVIEYGDDYYKWLYEQEKDEMTPHIKAMRAEEEINKMQENNSIQAWDWLHGTEGTKEDWRNKLSGLPAGTYIIRGENVRGEGGYGENVYRMVLDIKDNGRLIESREIYSTEGGHSANGVIGTATVTYKNGNFDLVTTQAPSASEQK